MNKINQILSKIYIFIFVFTFIYSPRLFFKYDPIIILTIISVFSLLVFYHNENFSIAKSKKLIGFCFRFVLSIFYISFIVFITSRHILVIYRFAVIIIQVVPCVLYLCFYFKKHNYTVKKLCRLIIQVSFFQSIISFLMFVVPSFRQFILNILIGNDLFKFMIDNNIWEIVSSRRIYGITASYTFTMPILQAFIAVLALIFGLKYSYKYFLYVPFILFSSIINSRTGLFVFLIMSFISVIYLMLQKDKGIYKRFMALCIFLMIITPLSGLLIKSYSPVTFQWIGDSVIETKDLITGQNKVEGTFSALGTMFFLPKGNDLLFGTGADVFLENNYGTGGRTSDVGYVNDIFSGGLIFLILLYIPVIYLGLINFKNGSLEKIISIILVTTLLFVNVKGAVVTKNEFINTYMLLSIAMFILNEKKVIPQKQKMINQE